MKRTILRVVTPVLAVAVLVGTALVGALPASAVDGFGAIVGYATAAGSLTQSAGAVTTTIASAPCLNEPPAVEGYVDTPGGTSRLTVIAPRPTPPALTTTGVAWDNSLAALAANAGIKLVNGTYAYTLVCVPISGVPFNQLDGEFTLTGTTMVWAALPGPSSTTLTATPPAIATSASTVLTATVTPATAVGTVEFDHGAGILATGVTVAAGTASTTVTGAALGAGTDSVTAVFTPTDPAVLTGSTSVPFVVTVGDTAAVTTTTTLTTSPAAPTTSDVVTLTATLSPAGAVGSVTFHDLADAAILGTSSVTAGTATLSLPAGQKAGLHIFLADFTPTDAANYSPSGSTQVNVIVLTDTGALTGQNLTTTIAAAGTLTITASTAPVNLGTAALDATNTLLVTTPVNINNVTVTDTRAGQLGYTVTGQATDFVGGPDTINSENLGWTPVVVSGPATAGPVVAAAAGVAPGDLGPAGLKSGRILATAPVGASLGTAVLTASLILQAPTSTPAGTYNSTITLTVI